MKDIKTLGIEPDVITYTSDHFEEIMKHIELLLKEGIVYADDTPKDIVNRHERFL